MEKLSYDGFTRARDYILTHSEEIGRAWFRYQFEDSGPQAFLEVLAQYQRESGGFGGLYYEYDYQGVCLKSTEVALRYLMGMDERPGAGHPVIRNTMRFLLDQYRPEIGNWGEVLVPEVNQGVHCYWSSYKEEEIRPMEQEERVRAYDGNEKACFAGFVSYYSQLVPEELYRDILQYPVEHILRYWDEKSLEYDRRIFNKGEPYNFEYFLDFV
ncbi:MAG: hypothetical protein HFE94_07135, partial [Acutalibacter sp.]|nr:hypothetical protein [Acutalibacter sp.]